MELFVGNAPVEANKDSIMPAASQGHNAVDLNPITLSFQGELEKTFRDGYLFNSLRTVRFSLVAGIVLYCLFGMLDAFLIPELTTVLWTVRFAIVCPFLLAVIGFSYFPAFKRFFQFSMAAAMVVSGSGIIYMIAILPPPVNQTYYAGLILVLIWGYTFTRVRFVWATSAGWILVALYEIVATQVIQTPLPVLMNNNFFFISANLVGMFACYFIELYTRRDFFLAFKLEKEQEKVQLVNRRLEKIVAQRTAQLMAKNRELSEEIQERIRVEKGRAELESKFREAQKMEAIGRLAGGIAHDFNNLLMGIQGNVSLMQLNRKATHSFIEKLKNIEKYVIRGSDLTKQLLGFARRGKYQVNATNLNALIAESVTLFGRTNKEVAIRLELDSKLCLVEIDRGQIEQVLLNLLMNAWQAMPGGGELVIRTENRKLDQHRLKRRDAKAGPFVVVSVIDQGIGMDEATMQKIFDPFFTTKEMGRGTGMGLASAYGIIQNHGGFFEVSSEVGKGSTLSFFLPGAFSAEPALEKKDQRQLVNGRGRILLVDDEEMVTDVASQMLVTLGYTVQSASSGRDAIEFYASEGTQVDLVILDLIMPGMSGYKTFDRLKQMNPDIKVLLSSGYSLPEEANAIIEQGNSGFIQKPYDINDLSQKVREVLQ
jgi:two-component system, cell cycle sensor histidine kinase and response regulator CckA